MFRKTVFILVILLPFITSCKEKLFVSLRDTISLDGSWKFALDSAKVGIKEKWYAQSLSDSVKLPGTLDENNKGILNSNRQETMRLSRELMYAGMAWYQKDVIIPENWKGQHIRLMMERTKPTQVWVDTVLTGNSNDILTAQYYDLTTNLTPGKHSITILIDNGNSSVPGGITGSHAWTEHTQSNWNGIIGKFCLEAANPAHIGSVQIYPDADKKNVHVKIKIYNPEANSEKRILVLQANTWNTELKHKISPESFPITLKSGDNTIELTYRMGNKIHLWSEFKPALYKLNITLKGKKVLDNTTIDFGMRKFSAIGTQFAINGIKTLLRGKHDACVFPLTGYPPMDVEGWRKVDTPACSIRGSGYRRYLSAT